MKKICYITTIGSTIHAFFVPQLKYLQENGYEVTVICSPDYPELESELGSAIRYIPVQIPRGISILGMIKATKELKRIFLKEQFDLIQYSTPNAALCSSIAGKKAKIKRRNYHLMGLRYLGAGGALKTILKKIEKTTCGLSTSIECVSKSNLKMAIEEGLFGPEKGTVVWNGSSGGVDLNRFDISKRNEYRQETRARYSISDDEFVFGFVGRITRDKGVEELLKAFEKINHGKLLMVGNLEEPLDKELYERSKANEKIVYTGAIKEIEKIYCAMDVLVLSSYREGFGMVIAEAAAMGTPAIVSNIPGPIDVVEIGKTAITVEPRNVDSLEKAMNNCLTGEFKVDPAECNRFIGNTFDSEELCKVILKRKEELLRAG